MTARAKWNAWAQSSKDYGEHLPAAEERYLEIARSLGWTEGQAKTADEERLSPEDAGRTGSGMGASVSMMAPPPPEDGDAGELHSLAVNDDGEALSEYLKSSPGYDINLRDEYGYTALHLASDRGSTSAVEVLLKAGADKNLKDEDEYTAVELARIAGHGDIVALLEST
ncbi:ankyrin [Auriscalpium vulgare]|uniref:Ankyrin n=1 Tax=Auriscalpium vulgare TaxID=40419 RepID=A0ACB8SBN3_9AGAM|nr:ankyrin [Auriscalpium vulgare]